MSEARANTDLAESHLYYGRLLWPAKLMNKQCLRNTILAIVALVVGFGQQRTTPAQGSETNRKAINVVATPDLRISEFVFPANNDKTVRVRIANTGSAASAVCILRLTVRKINGVPVGRVIEIKLPPLAAGKDKWLGINANDILPKNISLESTTFKLNADATSIVTESDEANNEAWHNL